VSQIATGVADAFLSATGSMIGEAKAKRSHRGTKKQSQDPARSFSMTYCGANAEVSGTAAKWHENC
jgi:hypothetical protein